MRALLVVALIGLSLVSIACKDEDRVIRCPDCQGPSRL
jgi:hypothetical protein